MELRQIVAIIRPGSLEKVEKSLKEIGVSGICVSRGKGYGEHADFFTRDWMVAHARLEVFAEKSRVEKIVETIMDAAHTGVPGDGLVAVIPVERLYRIRSKSEAKPEEI